MKIFKYLGFCGLLIFAGCITDIEFDVPGTVQDAIVIQAKVVKGNPSIVDVQVVNAVDFTGQSPIIAVAEAILNNITSGQSISLPTTDFNARGASIPEGDPNMNINFTDEYTLTVRSVNGQVFTSTPEKMYDVPEADEVTYEVVEIETETIKGLKTTSDVLEFRLNSPTRNSNNELGRMRWSFSQVYSVTDTPVRATQAPKVCYITENLGAVAEVSYNANELKVDRLDGFFLSQSAISNTYAEGSYFQTIQQSLSEGAYEYFEEIQGLLSRDGGVFDPPAGQVRTNFERSAESTSDVFGYFYMTSHDTIRVFIDPDDLGAPQAAICPPNTQRPGSCPLAVCCDCLDAKNSTDIKPDWWQ